MAEVSTKVAATTNGSNKDLKHRSLSRPTRVKLKQYIQTVVQGVVVVVVELRGITASFSIVPSSQYTTRLGLIANATTNHILHHKALESTVRHVVLIQTSTIPGSFGGSNEQSLANLRSCLFYCILWSRFFFTSKHHGAPAAAIL
jgi:hypothetical protein